MTLRHKKIAVLLEHFFEDVEVLYPYYRLKEEEAHVVLLGPEKGISYKGKYGYPLTAELGINDANAKTFDAVIVPGGYAPDHLRRHPKMIQFVKDMHDSGKVVAGICHAGWVLISAGAVRGKKVTSFFAIKDDMVNAGGIWVDEEVVKDGNVITSRTPADLPVFCCAVIGAVEEQR